MDRELLVWFAKQIEERLGIVYEEHNYFQLQNRLEELARTSSATSVQELRQMILAESNGTLRSKLLDVATNNETSFFRDPRVFDALEQVVLPDCLGRFGQYGKLRIWSAACSFGQEPYSLAMTMERLGMRQPPGMSPLGGRYEILATDVADRALDRAQAGLYTAHETGRGLSAALREKYLIQEGEQYRVRPELRARVTFKKVNLRNPLPEIGKFHLILCRNVLIYQRVEGKAEVIERLASRLEPGGYLLLGAGESLLGVSTTFEQRDKGGTMFYQVKGCGLEEKKYA